MKTKTAKGTKRLLSAALAFAMTAGLLPAPAHAAGGSVKYHRDEPETAIFNLCTGNVKNLYEELKSDDSAYRYYNAVSLYDGHKYSDRADNNTEWKFTYNNGSLNGTTLKTLMQVENNLEVDFAVTLNNMPHSHSHYKFPKNYETEHTIYESAGLSLGGEYIVSRYGSSEGEKMVTRQGDQDYRTLEYSSDEGGKLDFSKSTFYYHDFKDRYCDAAGVFAEKVIVAFRDSIQPRIANVYYSTDGGKTWVQRWNSVRVGKGGTVLIKLSYDEPLRFADDSPNHDLNLRLQAYGSSVDDSLKAPLVELNGKDLIFSYTVQDENKQILTLDTGELFGRDLPMVQLKGAVNGGGSFSIDRNYKFNNSTNGISTSTCYITDLAGNPLREQNVSSANLILDSQAPFVESIEKDLGLNNADIKAMPGAKKEDNSDLYLGVGDTAAFSVVMNERLALEDSRWDKAVAATNIKDENDQFIQIRAQQVTTYSKSNVSKTKISFAPITVTSGMTVDGDKIKITSLEFDEQVCDLAGNVFTKTAVEDDINTNPPMLDVDPPEITAAADYGENGFVFDAESGGFTYKFDVSDPGNKSGITGLTGSFILNQQGDGRQYEYRWFMSALPREHKDITEKEWNTGIIGQAKTFDLANKYLYIEPLTGTRYDDLSGCTLTISAKDYAGNRSEVVLPGADTALDWYVDTVAPTIRTGDATRRLDGDTGLLTVNASLSDMHGISEWDYIWTDDDTVPDKNDSWEKGTLDSQTTDGTPVEVSVKKTVRKDENFAGYLWLQATDNAAGKQNPSDPVCLGRYTYNLTIIKYTLQYSNELRKTAELKLSALDDGGTVVFMVKNPEKEDRYAVRALSKAEAADIIDKESNLFLQNGWYEMTVQQDENGHYLFSDLNAAQPWWDDVQTGMFVGTLNVKVLAGLDEAFDYASGDSTVPKQAGTETQPISEEEFTLRTVGEDQVQSYKNIALHVDADDTVLRTTPGGVMLNVSIGKDLGGWNYEDLDIAHSYVTLSNMQDGTESRVYLNTFTIAEDGSASQTLEIPDRDYATGCYVATLHLSCVSGKTMTESGDKNIYVDATKPDDDFSLQSVVYTPIKKSIWPNPYGLADTYGSRSCVEENGVVMLPVSRGYAVGSYQFTDRADDVRQLYELKVKFENEAKTTELDGMTAGGSQLNVWNVEDEEHPITLRRDDTNKVFTNKAWYGTNTMGFAFTDQGVTAGTDLYLKPNADNVIAMQKVYDNGETSSIKYITLRPVTDYVDGTAEADPQSGRLIFTPQLPEDGSVTTAGLNVFAWTNLEDEEYANGEGERLAMEAQPDGTWSCDLLSGSRMYTVITESANGALCEADSAYQRTPRLTDWPNDKDNGIEGIHTADNGDGTYTMTFRVRGDSDLTEHEINLNLGMTFHSGGTEKLTELALDADLSDGRYSWNTESEQLSGIYEVTAASDYIKYHRVIDFTVKGVYPSDADTMDAKIAVTDAFGGRGEYTQSGFAVNAREPQATGVAVEGNRVKVTFDQLVRPVESWAWKEKDDKGYRTEWLQAFPIAGNGTHTIQFKDIFGTVHSQEVTTDAFGDWGLDFSISPERETTEPVTLTANADNGIVMVWQERNGTKYGVPDVNGKQKVQKYQTQFTERTEVEVDLYESEAMSVTSKLNLRVYVDNIVNGAPEANVQYYIPSLGQQFTRSELEQYIEDRGGSVTVNSNVTVSYQTSRHVVPAEDTGSAFVFTMDNQTASHTFVYVDDWGQQGSVEVSLPSGLTLDVPPEDHTPPTVSVDIYAKRSNAYTRAATFLPEDTERDADDEDSTAYKFSEMSYVQGYSLTINARDDSGYTIEVQGDGAELSGNTLTITKPGIYTVTVTDKSGFDNQTAFTLTVPDMIDTEAPQCVITSVPTSMYAKNWYITFTDNKDASLVELTAPTGLSRVPADTTDEHDKKHIGAYKYVVANNGTVQFTFHDVAGNAGTSSKTAEGIDTEPPKLTVRWSPPYIDSDSGERDESRPTLDWINTSVTAHIESSKALENLTVRAENESEEQAHPLLTNGTADAYEIKGQGGRTLVRFAAKPDRITVTWYDNYTGALTFKATSPNGKSSEMTLGGVGTIDKDAPEIDETQTEVKRSGYSRPYQVKVTLRPNEKATASNYGVNGKVYEYDTPLELTFTKDGTYNVHFTDAAGNLTIHPVTITGVDNTAPVLTVSDLTDVGQTATVEAAVDEPCVLTWGTSGRREVSAGTHKITFDANGTYSITATDEAGNSSFKTVRVGTIDTGAPSIRFSNTTIYLIEGSSDAELTAELVKGCTVTDNVSLPDAIQVDMDTSLVDLNKAGQYNVTYTVTDEAGNFTKAVRLVRVIGADSICLNVDGKLTIPDDTAVLTAGTHTLTLANSTEPYSIKARKGILSTGQMKYLNGSSLSFGADGTFTVTDTGYYTVLVTTQSRETIRLLLYVER